MKNTITRLFARGLMGQIRGFQGFPEPGILVIAQLAGLRRFSVFTVAVDRQKNIPGCRP
jgi:hypothetical protein